jgi:hypothetical protein
VTVRIAPAVAPEASGPNPTTAAEVARLSTEEIMELAAETARRQSSLAGLIVLLAGELDRRQGWRAEGATSLENWMVERLGVSVPTARSYAHVGQRIGDLPQLTNGLTSGELTFDKVRAVVDGASPETDAEVAKEAGQHSVRELVQLARARRRPSRPGPDAPAEEDRRTVRFNDTYRTVTAQLPPTAYAEARSCLEARAKRIGSDGETPWDQRLADAFIEVVRSGSGRGGSAGGSPFVVVAHVPLEVLTDEDSDLCGELERDGLISADVVRRLACDATLIVAADDDAGHTMYEGRQRRLASDSQRREVMRRDRHCRFPGCANVTFAVPHHVRAWKPDHGPTDLENLALICEHHHHLVHSKAWSMTGNANDELVFVGPTGRVMTSRPSPLWAAASRPAVRSGGP